MISFVIPAHNEEEKLGSTLHSLRRAIDAVARPCEILVVDDASTDRTAQVAQAAGAQVIPVCKRQISAVRNAGAARARGQKLIFLDADTLLPADTLRAALLALQQGAIGGGARIQFDEHLQPFAGLLTGGWNLLARTCRWAAGCFLFVKREAFEAAGGYDETLFAAEEIGLSERLKQQGPFVILTQPVITSARKLKNGPGPILKTTLQTFFSGGKNLSRREGLTMWYADAQNTRPLP